jgi:hypothetical protein
VPGPRSQVPGEDRTIGSQNSKLQTRNSKVETRTSPGAFLRDLCEISVNSGRNALKVSWRQSISHGEHRDWRTEITEEFRVSIFQFRVSRLHFRVSLFRQSAIENRQFSCPVPRFSIGNLQSKIGNRGSVSRGGREAARAFRPAAPLPHSFRTIARTRSGGFIPPSPWACCND